MEHKLNSKEEKMLELSEDALENVTGGFCGVNGKEVDPNSTCMNYVCAICGGSWNNHVGNCDHPRLNCCGSCAKVVRDSGMWFCGSSRATK